MERELIIKSELSRELAIVRSELKADHALSEMRAEVHRFRVEMAMRFAAVRHEIRVLQYGGLLAVFAICALVVLSA